MSAVRERLGNLCDQYSRRPALRREIFDAGAEVEVEEVFAFLRGQQKVGMWRLKALMDVIDEVCVRNNKPAVTTVRTVYESRLKLPRGFGPPPGTPPLATWVCPNQRCARVVFALADTQIPPLCLAAGAVPLASFRNLD